MTTAKPPVPETELRALTKNVRRPSQPNSLSPASYSDRKHSARLLHESEIRTTDKPCPHLQAIDSALSTADRYVSAQTESWNGSITTKILQSLVAHSKLSPPQADPSAQQNAKPPQYKYAVNSTIVEVNDAAGGASSGTQTGTETNGSAGEGSSVGARRGMHCATAGYWNNETDGMWNYKWEGGSRGMDVVVSVIWVMV